MLSNQFLKAVAVVVSLTAINAQASLIKNGSFEPDAFNDLPPSDKMSNAYIYQTSRDVNSLATQADTNNRWGVYNKLPGWSMLYNKGVEINANGLTTSVNGVKTEFNAQDGKHFIELDTHADLLIDPKQTSGVGTVTNASNAGIYQTLNNLTIGNKYELTFWYRARNTNIDDNLLDLFWLTADDLPNYASKKFSTVDFNSAVVVGNKLVNNHEKWVQYKFDLTADSKDMVLGFGASGKQTFSFDYQNVKYTSFDGSKQGALLDNVSLTAKVPEPATLAMFGLAAAGLLVRRRKA
jgi:hypothetical protein